MLAPFAFLASAAATLDLQDRLLPQESNFPYLSHDHALAIWVEKHSTQIPEGGAQASQKSWDKASVIMGQAILEERLTDLVSRAWLLAVKAPHSEDWLKTWPITASRLRLNKEAIRVFVGLRLGANLCAPHHCPCGTLVDARGIYGLFCRKSAGR